jgi:hypothetical protein
MAEKVPSRSHWNSPSSGKWERLEFSKFWRAKMCEKSPGKDVHINKIKS